MPGPWLTCDGEEGGEDKVCWVRLHSRLSRCQRIACSWHGGSSWQPCHRIRDDFASLCRQRGHGPLPPPVPPLRSGGEPPAASAPSSQQLRGLRARNASAAGRCDGHVCCGCRSEAVLGCKVSWERLRCSWGATIPLPELDPQERCNA